MNYHKQRETVEAISAAHRGQDNIAVSCPFCTGGGQTLSITKKGSRLLWNCYRASCAASGISQRQLDRSELAKAIASLSDKRISHSESSPAVTFDHSHLFPVSRSSDAERYIAKYEIKDAIDAGLAMVRYDMKQHRIVFLVKDMCGNVVDAVGRSLYPKGKPKWVRYNNQPHLFVSGKGSHVVLVEDATSAVKVSLAFENTNVFGSALLGTHITKAHLSQLRHFEKCTLVLDKDASVKAVKYHSLLSSVIPTTISLTNSDLKDLSCNQIRAQLNNQS